MLTLVALAGIEPRFGCGCDALVLLPFMPWHFLYFFPLPHGHGSFLPTFPAMLNNGIFCVIPGSQVYNSLQESSDLAPH
jgi:hypothetical protein